MGSILCAGTKNRRPVLAKLLREVPASSDAPSDEPRFTVKVSRQSEPSDRPKLGV